MRTSHLAPSQRGNVGDGRHPHRGGGCDVPAAAHSSPFPSPPLDYAETPLKCTQETSREDPFLTHKCQTSLKAKGQAVAKLKGSRKCSKKGDTASPRQTLQ